LSYIIIVVDRVTTDQKTSKEKSKVTTSDKLAMESEKRDLVDLRTKQSSCKKEQSDTKIALIGSIKRRHV
jgi:hypothetical protein